MDSHVFDHLTRLLSAPRSRRAAWHALLGAALLGATTRPAAAAPTSPCETGEQEYCGSGKDNCCPGKCFVVDLPNAPGGCPVCCTEPEYVMCVVTTTDETGKTRREPTCCKKTKDACGKCEQPTPTDETCPSLISGSYRRR